MESEILIAAISVLGTAIATIPAITKYRSKLGDVKSFFITLDDSLADGEITPEEAKRIMRQAKRIFNL